MSSDFKTIETLIRKDIEKFAELEIKNIQKKITDEFKGALVKRTDNKLEIEFKDTSEYDKGKIYFEDMIQKMGFK